MDELPPTDDPHELLGVAPDANADEVRRAYLRKIKVFKPDRDPVAFRRLRTAYETLAERIALLEQVSPRASAEPSGWDRDASEASQPTARKDRLRELTAAVAAALAEGRRDEAARLLLTPQAEILATDAAFMRPLLNVCAATVISAAPLRQALEERYADIVRGTDAARAGNHPLWELAELAEEGPAWLGAMRSMPELTALLELAAVVDGPASRRIAEQVAERVGDDPEALLAALDAAQAGAPGLVTVLRDRARTWADAASPSLPPIHENAPTAVALARQLHAAVSTRGTIGRAWAARLGITFGPALAMLAFGVAPVPVAVAVFSGALVYRVGFDATRTIYRTAVRPTVMPWLVATGQPLQLVAAQLRRQLDAARLGIRPDAPMKYPELLEHDAALLTFAALTRLTKSAQ